MSYDECCEKFRCGTDECEEQFESMNCYKTHFENGKKNPAELCKLPTTVSPPAEVAVTTTPSVPPVDEPSPGL